MWSNLLYPSHKSHIFSLYVLLYRMGEISTCMLCHPSVLRVQEPMAGWYLTYMFIKWRVMRSLWHHRDITPSTTTKKNLTRRNDNVDLYFSKKTMWAYNVSYVELRKKTVIIFSNNAVFSVSDRMEKLCIQIW